MQETASTATGPTANANLLARQGALHAVSSRANRGSHRSKNSQPILAPARTAVQALSPKPSSTQNLRLLTKNRAFVIEQVVSLRRHFELQDCQGEPQLSTKSTR